MLANLQTDAMLMLIASVAMPAFLFGLILDAVMREDGFGSIGNAVVLAAGFFLGIFVFNHYGVRFRDMTYGAAIGLSGAFLTIFVLAVFKAGLQRMMLR